MKFALMGQNGAGKSTIFGLISGSSVPESGIINVFNGVSIASARQVIPREQLDLTVREFFEKCFKDKVYDIDPRIDNVLEVVNLKDHAKIHDKIVRTFSGGQQARLLLASALIQDPDLLLLDDVFKGKLSDGLEQAIYSIISLRTENEKPTILTLNDVGETLLARMSPDRGPALVRRLREFCEMISFTKPTP